MILIRNFRVRALDLHVKIFSLASKLATLYCKNITDKKKVANLSQNVRHSARGQNMQISTVDVIRCVNLQAMIEEWEVFH